MFTLLIIKKAKILIFDSVPPVATSMEETDQLQRNVKKYKRHVDGKVLPAPANP